MNVVFAVTLTMVSVAGLLTTVRLLRGPGALDRIVALDMLVTLIVAGAATGIAARRETTSLPVLVVLALLAFVGTVTAAYLVERREGMR
ncbi:monovalent cation/H+ antiporter complex subunit F [Streptomyces sp. DSM 42041]|uniref:Monovalent cation/H+ antiporter complex subunit F n=1 Tax=Streptomyces hazeniae TaxID=3075538 RepID=A0ABU2NMW0_9ACTN|nr:monovalent cation/H+ antiporter complex subunit F [Streptomyces sp. DSM 42041]MDT0378283.1 monovalent cation/H+ antiporter complex subunit F [Streptomyces sp. DSM 42041]